MAIEITEHTSTSIDAKIQLNNRELDVHMSIFEIPEKFRETLKKEIKSFLEHLEKVYPQES